MTEHVEKTDSSSSFIRHWPTICLGLIVATIFLIAIFSYQVKQTEVAVVTTFGKITENSIKKPGFHFRWPYPINSIYKFDIRMRCFDGNVGKIEETFTKDSKNLIVGIYVIYSIENPAMFFKSVVDIPNAEDRLNSIMRTMKDGVIGGYNFDQIVNTDPQKMELRKIENEIGKGIAKIAQEQYGIAIHSVGIKSLGVPEKVTEKVFDRMIKERKVIAQKYRSEGDREAKKIKYEAEKQKSLQIAEAEAKAKKIRAEGDAQAAAYYAAFQKNPALAAFLRKLDSLRKIMSTKTTLILDTDSAPFDLLKMNFEKLNKKTNQKINK